MLIEISYFKVIIITSNNVRRKLELESFLENISVSLAIKERECLREKYSGDNDFRFRL